MIFSAFDLKDGGHTLDSQKRIEVSSMNEQWLLTIPTYVLGFLSVNFFFFL